MEDSSDVVAHSAEDAEMQDSAPACRAEKLCAAEGCDEVLSNQAKYARQRGLCTLHMKGDAIRKRDDSSEQLYRFCFQCGKLQQLEDFDGNKRSCRVQLAKRRTVSFIMPSTTTTRAHAAAAAASGAASADSGNNSGASSAGKLRPARAGVRKAATCSSLDVLRQRARQKQQQQEQQAVVCHRLELIQQQLADLEIHIDAINAQTRAKGQLTHLQQQYQQLLLESAAQQTQQQQLLLAAAAASSSSGAAGGLLDTSWGSCGFGMVASAEPGLGSLGALGFHPAQPSHSPLAATGAPTATAVTPGLLPGHQAAFMGGLSQLQQPPLDSYSSPNNLTSQVYGLLPPTNGFSLVGGAAGGGASFVSLGCPQAMAQQSSSYNFSAAAAAAGGAASSAGPHLMAMQRSKSATLPSLLTPALHHHTSSTCSGCSHSSGDDGRVRDVYDMALVGCQQHHQQLLSPASYQSAAAVNAAPPLPPAPPPVGLMHQLSLGSQEVANAFGSCSGAPAGATTALLMPTAGADAGGAATAAVADQASHGFHNHGMHTQLLEQQQQQMCFFQQQQQQEQQPIQQTDWELSYLISDADADADVAELGQLLAGCQASMSSAESTDSRHNASATPSICSSRGAIMLPPAAAAAAAAAGALYTPEMAGASAAAGGWQTPSVLQPTQMQPNNGVGGGTAAPMTAPPATAFACAAAGSGVQQHIDFTGLLDELLTGANVMDTQQPQPQAEPDAAAAGVYA